jgi:predicted HTH transcriptional regulator
MGTGTTDIIEQCKAMGLPTPTFRQDSFFQVTLFRKPQGEPAQSLFYEMFGDPITNEKGWEVKPLDLQQQFASKIEAIEHQKELIKQSINEVETLFNSRMDYYFN